MFQAAQVTGPSVGLANVSVATDSNTDGTTDVFPPVEVRVRLDQETWKGFPCKRDTASDVNAIREMVLERLGRSRRDLAKKDFEGPLRGLSEERIPGARLDQNHIPRGRAADAGESEILCCSQQLLALD